MDNNKTARFVYIASDHNGNAARAWLVRRLRDVTSISLVDLGPGENEGKVDYVDYASMLSQHVRIDESRRGILICGTGTGMSIVANKHQGIRAGLATDRATAVLMREHNDCNVMCLGQWRNSLEQMEDIVQAFLTTKFGEGRHTPRVEKLKELDKCK